MTARSWRWLRVRIVGCFVPDSRVARHFFPDEHGQRGAPR